jgi:hypothetical protein
MKISACPSREAFGDQHSPMTRDMVPEIPRPPCDGQPHVIRTLSGSGTPASPKSGRSFRASRFNHCSRVWRIVPSSIALFTFLPGYQPDGKKGIR